MAYLGYIRVLEKQPSSILLSKNPRSFTLKLSEKPHGCNYVSQDSMVMICIVA